MSTNKNILWIDYIRVAATFLVVLLHSVYPILENYNKLPLRHWWIGNIFYSMSTICVPLFFMLTGLLLLEKTDSLSFFFSKRIHKVIIPLLVWSGFYILWRAFYEKSITITFYTFYSILFTPIYHHFWFLYTIIGLYLFIPILRIIVQNASHTIQYYFIVLWVLSVSIIPFAEEAFHIKSYFDLSMISGYVGYLVVGYLLGKIELIRKQVILASVIGVFSMMITALGSFYCIIQNQGKFYRFFYGYLTPNVFTLSVCGFIIFKYLAEKKLIFHSQIMNKIIRHISSASLGIYMIHIMFLTLLEKGTLGFTIGALHGNPIYSVPATALVTFLMSFFAIFLMKKIPVIKRCVP